MGEARDAFQSYQDANVYVIALNPATMENHQKYTEKHKFPFPLVHDAKGAIAAQYEVPVTLGMPKRTVYIIDEARIVRYAKEGLPETEELLTAVAEMS